MSRQPRTSIGLRNRTARTLVAATVAALAASIAATPARADGDPASDYLLTQNVFVPFNTKFSPTLTQQLAGLTLDGKRKRYPIKVALIATPYDLGAITALWRKPQRYAHFLAQEIAFAYRGRLLIVMPNGFGIYHLGHSTATEKQVLARLSVAQGGNGMAGSAIAAVKQLAAANGVKLVPRRADTPSARNTHDRYVILLIVAGVLLVLVIFMPLRRRKTASTSESHRK
jgi:hypothetical protein